MATASTEWFAEQSDLQDKTNAGKPQEWSMQTLLNKDPYQTKLEMA